MLEAARRCETRPCVVLTSTNKVYGSLSHLPMAEHATRFEPIDAEVFEMGSRGGGLELPLSVRVLQRCGGSICTGLFPLLWATHCSVPDELYLWTAPIGK